MQSAIVPHHSLLRRFAVLFTALILIAPLLGNRHVIYSHLRATTMCLATLGFLTIAITRPTFSLLSLFKFPDLPAIAFLLWAAARFIQSTPAAGPEYAMATNELLRTACGVLLFLAVTRAITTRRQLHDIWLTILICASVDSLAGIATVRPALHVAASAAYFNKQLLAAFLVGLIPFTFVVLLSGPTMLARRTALLTIVLLLSALLLTGNRTSWAGAFVGLFFAAILTPRKTRPAAKKRRLLFPLVGVALIIDIVSLTGARGFLRQRFDSDSFKTFEYRYPLWKAAIEMIRQHPYIGVGIGAYPLHASAADNNTHAIPSMQDVMRTGPTLWCIGHNEYLQTAAEIGLIGFALYLLVLLSFLFLAIKNWSRAPSRFNRALLAATTSAVIAQCIDALANPGWRFLDVSPILWLMLALGTIAFRRTKGQTLDITTEPEPLP
jgi:O-antigen ligase